MPRLSEHEPSGAILMLKAGVRVSDVARYHNWHPVTIQRLRECYQATGTINFDAGLISQEWWTALRAKLRQLCIDDIYIDDIRSSWEMSVQDE